MNLPYHRLSREMFAALATGGGGGDAVRELVAAEYSKHMILLCGVLTSAQGTEQYPLARMGYDLLAEVWHSNRAVAEQVIRHPSVGAWARRTIQACRGGPAMAGAKPGGLRSIGAAAAIRAGLSANIEVGAANGWAVLPSLGIARVCGISALVRSGRGRAEVGPVEIPEHPYQDAPGWLGLREVRTGGLDVLIDDLDPFRMPDAPSLAPRQAVESWDAALQQAWLVLECNHPVAAAEIAEAISVIVPRYRPPIGEASTTSPEAFGAVAMSVPPDPVACAEMLVHETQHLKLAALMDIVTLTLPDDGRRYYAPWRDDPRPLSGLLQGTYAFLGVTGFWRRQRKLADNQRQADAKYARRRVAVMRAVETLRSSGMLTSVGLEFVGGMAHTVSLWQEEPIPAHVEAEARRAAKAHSARWQRVNGPLPGR